MVVVKLVIAEPVELVKSTYKLIIFSFCYVGYIYIYIWVEFSLFLFFK